MIYKIRSIMRYILSLLEDEEIERGKILMLIHIDVDNIFKNGNIKIDAYGKWMQKFCVQKFKAKAWRNTDEPIYIRFGIQKTNSYQLYTIANEIQLEPEPEAFIDGVSCYLSFVIKVPVPKLLRKFSSIRKYIQNVSMKHPSIRIKLTANNQFWKEDERTLTCINMICESFSDVMTYDLSNNFRDNVLYPTFVATNQESVIKKIKDNLSISYLNPTQIYD